MNARICERCGFLQKQPPAGESWKIDMYVLAKVGDRESVASTSVFLTVSFNIFKGALARDLCKSCWSELAALFAKDQPRELPT